LRQLFEIFYIFKIQRRIVSAETIRGNTVCGCLAVSSGESPLNLPSNEVSEDRVANKDYSLEVRVQGLRFIANKVTRIKVLLGIDISI
jgi:hypothetical protein